MKTLKKILLTLVLLVVGWFVINCVIGVVTVVRYGDQIKEVQEELLEETILEEDLEEL